MPGPIYIINGPNTNLLGQREPDVYGHLTLEQIEMACAGLTSHFDCEARCFQSNCEGKLIDWIHEASREQASGIIINPGGYSHTSVALRDALAAVKVPAVEVHLSNVHAREPFRHSMITGGAVLGVICGLGLGGYLAAIRYLLRGGEDDVADDAPASN
jgi:3-dehydroquinate dehydratase-2